LAYGKTSLPQKAIFNDTPDGAGGGLWNSGGAAAIDDQSGEVYIMTGVDAGDPPSGYNDSFLRMSADNLSVEDFFQPDDESFLASAPNQSHSAPVQASAEARIAASSGGVERVAVRPSRTTIRGSCLFIAVLVSIAHGVVRRVLKGYRLHLGVIAAGLMSSAAF
jgi:hypothetical protein